MANVAKEHRLKRLVGWAYRLAIVGCLAPVAYAALLPAAHHPVMEWPQSVALLLALCGPIGGLLGFGLALRWWRVRWSAPPRPVAAMWVGLMATAANVFAFPSIDQMMVVDSGYHRSCLSNVKQLGLATLMYSQDWDERAPRTAGWTTALWPYLKYETVFRCPDEPDQRPVSYACNRRMGGCALPNLASPERTVLLFDSIPTSDPVGWTELLPRPPRHGEGDTFGFADGHTKWYVRDDVTNLVWHPVLKKAPAGHTKMKR